MSTSLDDLVAAHGRTYADEVGIRLADEPAPLFQLLVLTHLLSANLSAELGLRAARAVRQEFRTAIAMAEATDDQRWQVLSEARYLRKEQTARQLGEMATHLVEEYAGDLRRLHDRADGDPGRIGELLQEFAGVGPLGADIFRREAQAVWPSLRPFLDEKAAAPARELGLPHTAAGLARRTGDDDLSRVGAALVRHALEDGA